MLYDLLGLTACRCAFESAVRPVLSPVAGIKAHNRFTSGSEAAQLAECFSPQIVDILLSLYSQAKNEKFKVIINFLITILLSILIFSDFIV